MKTPKKKHIFDQFHWSTVTLFFVVSDILCLLIGVLLSITTSLLLLISIACPVINTDSNALDRKTNAKKRITIINSSQSQSNTSRITLLHAIRITVANGTTTKPIRRMAVDADSGHTLPNR